MIDWYAVLGPLVRLLDPERAHRLAIETLRRGFVPRPAAVDDPILSSILWGREFQNPVGLAAGFDKHGEVPDAMLAQGFGFVEVGGVAPQPQPGNPKPRLFSLDRDRAVINRFGFNTVGADVVAARLTSRRRAGIVGVNLGVNRSGDRRADLVSGATQFAPLADFLVINVSSPNTPGLRALQGRAELEGLLGAVKAGLALVAVRPPLLLKISPDLAPDDERDVAQVALDFGIDGIVATNTTLARPASLTDEHRQETGGLSGRPLFQLSTDVLRRMYRLTEGRVPLIGVGGIAAGRDAYAKIRAGASLVQLYSELVYEGPGLIGRIKTDLAQSLKADGFTSLAQAIGADHRT